jgi:hypothetical protein
MADTTQLKTDNRNYQSRREEMWAIKDGLHEQYQRWQADYKRTMEDTLKTRWEEKEATLKREREDMEAKKEEEKQRVAEERRLLAQLVSHTRNDVVQIAVGQGCAPFSIERWRLTQVAGSKLAIFFSGVRVSLSPGWLIGIGSMVFANRHISCRTLPSHTQTNHIR